MTQEIFVFGSNLAGRHGKGAALHAYNNHGAIRGQGEGLQGSSYAIPTKGRHLERLSLPTIHGHILRFLEFAEQQPTLIFKVTPVGCGLAGNSPKDIAPMFKDHTPNVLLPEEFKQVLRDTIRDHANESGDPR